ncbi:hypothetical protein WSM22_26390 [Cytophagales bacterium WSM2-2]|nr:hypothetical protein WSM22_26390 [Cytophagales bacterium WSM2-2]
MIMNPAANTITPHFSSTVIRDALNKKKQIVTFTYAHSKLTIGGDSPFPGGVAKGVGNRLPEMP